MSSLCSTKNYKSEQLQILKKDRSDEKLVSKKRILSHRINWLLQDLETAEEVRKVAIDIVKNETKLVRITKTEIGRTLRIQSLLVRACSKLPKT
ncbi:TnsD family Tn7-like transposition protein [Paenibacillus yanchengensis]|uniref:TnsD family Tn7-like transposition protein n=1 Tax=Paenibacillus yanchengensis TaxID=2035833 RepID=A0ABW4YF84_9BACL